MPSGSSTQLVASAGDPSGRRPRRPHSCIHLARRGAALDRSVRAWRDGAFELLISPLLLAELAEVLARPKFAAVASEGRAEAYVGALAAAVCSSRTRSTARR